MTTWVVLGGSTAEPPAKVALYVCSPAVVGVSEKLNDHQALHGDGAVRADDLARDGDDRRREGDAVGAEGAAEFEPFADVARRRSGHGERGLVPGHCDGHSSSEVRRRHVQDPEAALAELKELGQAPLTPPTLSCCGTWVAVRKRGGPMSGR
ncbi:hypothetical protein ACWCOT_44460 [Nonomuraea bangladeshensis]